MAKSPPEDHRVGRSGWLRAAVLGANDGIISTSSLLVGVASASNSIEDVITAGIAGLLAGALSMAAGEYVSVSSQADVEKADLARETKELEDDWEFETQELADIYKARGVDPALSRDVAVQLMKKDALGAHARDELGIMEITTPRPLQAAVASASAFSIGAALPLATVFISPQGYLIQALFGGALLFLAMLGAFGARIGGSKSLKPTLRVAFWGAFAMAATAGVGSIVGKVL